MGKILIDIQSYVQQWFEKKKQRFIPKNSNTLMNSTLKKDID